LFEGKNSCAELNIARDYPWNAIPVFDVSAKPPPAKPVPRMGDTNQKCIKPTDRFSTFALEFDDVLFTEFCVAYDALVGAPCERVGASLAGDVRARFHDCREFTCRTRKCRRMDVRNMRRLFEKVFLQQGQIASSSFFIAFALSSPPGRVESDEGEKEKETGIRFFKLHGNITEKMIRPSIMYDS
jgi:hypothetical protein